MAVSLTTDSIQNHQNDWHIEKATYLALKELLCFKFKNKHEVGNALDRYNGAECIDIFREASKKIVKSPVNYLILLKQLTKENYTKPSYGLKCEGGYRNDNYIHFLYENGDSTTGICYFDQKRPLSVKQIHACEKSLITSGIDKTIIVANKIGIPAKNEVTRINNEYSQPIIDIEHFNSMKIRYLRNYIS